MSGYPTKVAWANDKFRVASRLAARIETRTAATSTDRAFTIHWAGYATNDKSVNEPFASADSQPPLLLQDAGAVSVLKAFAAAVPGGLDSSSNLKVFRYDSKAKTWL
jgi:hypothetical protein